MKKLVFTGAATALITPMHQDGSVHYDALGALLDFQLNNGIDAIVTCGTTGESATLNHKEHCEVIRYTVDRVAGRVPVIAGTGSNDTAYSLELSKEAAAIGVDALLLVSPYYNKTSQAGLVRHFTTVADSVDLPCILYNVPSRTGCNIKPETYLTLSKHPNIVATKEANGDLSAAAVTASLCGDDLVLYSGNDDQVVPMLSLGGRGVISVFSNLLPKVMHDIIALWFQQKQEESRRLFLEWLDLMNAFFMDVNPIPIKEAANLMGMQAGPCRLPLVEMDGASRQKLKNIMEKHGMLPR